MHENEVTTPNPMLMPQDLDFHRDYYQNKNHKPSVSFKFDDQQYDEPMLIDSDNDDININGKSVHPQTLQIKNRIMSQIIQHKIFSQNKLISFFKSTLQEYGEDDEIILSIIRDLCTEFHVPFQKVMVDTPDDASVTTLL